MIALGTWPVIATDPNWELRQGRTFSRVLSDASVLTGQLIWSTSEGFTAEISVDGKPLVTTTLNLADLRILAELTTALADTYAEMTNS